MSRLPGGLEQAFEIAAGELGFCTASWLFARETAAMGGDALVAELRETLGRAFPVLDFVARRWLDGCRGPEIDVTAAVAACEGATRVLVAGLEAAFLDALIPALPGARIGIVRARSLAVDWDRVLANYGGRLEETPLDAFQAWAGSRSAILTFVYGIQGATLNATPEWLRITGADTRAQFRSIVGWDVLGAPLYVYPRWLVEVSTDDFTQVIAR